MLEPIEKLLDARTAFIVNEQWLVGHLCMPSALEVGNSDTEINRLIIVCNDDIENMFWISSSWYK